MTSARTLITIFIILLAGCVTDHERCEQHARDLLPSRLVLSGPLNGSTNSLSDEIWWLENYTLTTGETFSWSYTRGIPFSRGTSAGQNIHSFYPDAQVLAYARNNGWIQLPSTLSYNRTVIAANGDIVGENTFTAIPVLQPTGITTVSGRSDLRYVQVFTVVSYNIADCRWVT